MLNGDGNVRGFDGRPETAVCDPYSHLQRCQEQVAVGNLLIAELHESHSKAPHIGFRRVHLHTARHSSHSLFVLVL